MEPPEEPKPDAIREALRYAAILAHQVKGPIGAAGSLLKTVLGEYAGRLNASQKDLLERADRRIDEAVETAARVLGLMRADGGDPPRTDVAALAARIVQRHQEAAAARQIHLSLEAEAAPGAAAAALGEAALTETLNALLENALKYTPAQGRVLVAVEPAPGQVRLRVADSGMGVSEEERARIFQPFYRAPAAARTALPGAGLGLALVRAVVEAAGGSIDVQRAALGGAEFVCTLPAAPAEPEADANRMRVVIVGGVAAGPKVASKVARLRPDADITIVERSTMLSFAGCGLPYYVSGVVRDQRELLSTPLGAVRDPVFFQRTRNVRVLIGAEAVDLDRAARRVRVRRLPGGEEVWLPYDKLVLATGAGPIVPDLPGVRLRHIFALHGIRDAEGIRALLDEDRALDVVIVGGGLIGVETTEALVRRGCRVTIVEMRPHILGMFDPEMARLVERHLESQGVRILTGTRAVAFEGDGEVRTVVTDRGPLPADLVILGVGVRPETTLARAAGLDLGPTGAIRVDARLLTSDPDIFAAGDCCEATHLVTGRPCWIPLGSTANKQGRVAAVNLCGGNDSFPGVLGSTVCRVFQWAVARTGLSEAEAREAGFDPVTAHAASPDCEHFMPEAGLLMLKLVADRGTRRLLGLQALGAGRGDKRVDVAATAIAAGLTVDQVAHLDLGYSPPYAPAIDNLLTAANIARDKLDGQFDGISAAELKGRLDRPDPPVLLDVGTVREHSETRLPGSVCIPLGTLRSRLRELPRDREIVAFCRLSIRGYEAAIILKAAGFARVRVLDGGLVMWPYEKVHTPP